MSTKYAIVGGKLIDGTGAEPVENSLVLVDDNGKIEYAGAMQDLPEGVEVIDAAGKPLGRVAAKAAVILRGKNKPTFTPNVDCGDHVIIINCAKAVLTGKKLENKYFYWHTGWIGGLKKIQYKELMEKNPEKAMTIAVNGMLPNNTIGRSALTRLRVYKDANHKNAAQKPVAYEF